MNGKSTAIVLAAGQGRRMNSATAKQFLMLKGKPLLSYSLQTFQECPFMDEIILVTGTEDIAFCKEEIVKKFQFTKVSAVTAGGAQRYHSVYNGLCAAENCDYVYIHDGARPFVTQQILLRLREAVQTYGACVAAMPVKDTIKISDEQGFCKETPKRSSLWQIQTPQTFSYPLIRRAYDRLMEDLKNGCGDMVTDDAMVLERVSRTKIRLVEGAYDNLKITTPDDLKLAETLI